MMNQGAVVEVQVPLEFRIVGSRFRLEITKYLMSHPFLYLAFLEDTIWACLNAGAYEVVISYPPGPTKRILADAIGNLKQTVPSKSRIRLESADAWLWPQESADVSRDMAAAINRCLDAGYPGVVLIDCVTPAISRRVLQSASKVLDSKDLVFGPTLEGSFYLLGMRKMIPQLFEKIDWSDNTAIYSKLVEVASADSLDWAELGLWYNLRQPGDLEFLARDINAFRIAGDEESAKRTERILEALIDKFHSEGA